ncbi:carbamate kinase [Granulosicoccus antarcticus]|uniref:Carbamate kinase n=1 Tax=Granulosicoccus antarcticus IMCC3135 TaxID=1192854 RepID=A0A2Z2NM65_9GAMM|nr:carbamate kinase [Granulosicoccus antarcticus]ASJ72273.1 Carbamate kinase 2 [Granulosicoccus antarcticus IMCC3135]
MLVVAALGGNALLRRGEPLTADVQRSNVITAVKSLADIVRAGHQLVITHGNGPQIGLLALQGSAYKPDELYPLDVLGAESEGMIGYMIEQELENALDQEQPVATLLTQIIVDINDPAFQNPTKFIGPIYTHEKAQMLADAAGWSIAQDGEHWRRVVPSPAPKDIPDLHVLQLLHDQGVIIVCAGGGGIPVVRRENGSLYGVEAVIDKDAASALLAEKLGAHALLLLTDVDAIYQGFGTKDSAPIPSLNVETAQALNLPAGSMKPKVEAACRFAQTGGFTGIGRLDDAMRILTGVAGSRIENTD